MTKRTSSRRSSAFLLILGMVFLTLGLATDQTAFTWAAIAFVLISLVWGSRWFRPRN